MTRFENRKNAENAQLGAEQNKRNGFLSKFMGAYEATYDARIQSIEKRQKHRKFCYGRMNLWQFVLFHVFIISNLLVLILIPLSYFLLIPMYLQHRVDLIGTDGNSIRIHRVAVGNMNATSISFAGDFRVDPLIFLPIYGGLNPTTMRMMSSEKQLVNVNLPETSFWLNKEVVLAFNATMTFTPDQLENTRALIASFSSPEGIQDLMINIRLNAPMTTFGMLLYTGLPLHRDISLGSVSSSVSDLLEIATAPMNPNLILVPVETNNDAALYANFAASDIFKIKGLSIVWDRLLFHMDDTSASIELGIAFENPTPLELAAIDGIEYYLEIEKTKVVKMGIHKLGVAPLLNSNFDVILTATFIDPLIDPTAVQNAIEQASKKDFEFALVGPITVTNADFVNEITKDLYVHGHVSDLVKLIPPSYLNMTDDPAAIASALSAVESILGKSKISLSALSDQITTELGLNLPVLDFIIPPKQISFPYYSTLSVFGLNGVKAMISNVAPVNITRIDNGGFSIDIEASLVPQNTIEAANDLASSVNPVLAAIPKASTIGLRDLAFFPPGGANFKWCDELFGKRLLQIGIPPINKATVSAFIAGISPALVNDLSKIITVDGIDLEQMTNQPGFSTNAKFQVGYPKEAPQINVDIGYFSSLTTVEDTSLVSLQLPNGLQFAPRNRNVAIHCNAIVSRDPQIGSKVQNMVNYVLQDSSPPSFAGFTGLIFGLSSTVNIITFSKVGVNIDTPTLISMTKSIISASNVSLASLTKFIPPGLIKVQGSDVGINSPTDVSIKVQTILKNPYKMTAKLGSVATVSLLNDQRFSGFFIAPLIVSSGTAPLDLSMTLQPSMGGNGMAVLVRDFVDDVQALNMNTKFRIGVSGFVMNPPGVTNGPAVIDQFQSVIFNTPASKLFSLISELDIESLASVVISPSSPIDVSAIIPTQQSLQLMKPVIKFVKLNCLSNSALSTGADVDYTNPLSVYINAPYIAISMGLNQQTFVDSSLAGFKLTRSQGSMRIRPDFKFYNLLESPDLVASLMVNFLQGKLASKVNAGGVYFGTSAGDRNDLFSKVNMDVTYILSRIAVYGKSIAEGLRKMEPVIVQHLAKRQLMQTNRSSIISISGPMGSNIVVNKVDVELKANKEIGMGLEAELDLPFPVDINCPYFGVQADLDSLKSFSMTSGVVAQGRNPFMSLSATIAVNDVDELADKIAAITAAFFDQRPIPGNLVVGRIVMGVSPTDNINCFSKVGVSLGLDELAASLKRELDLNSLIANSGIDINTLGVSIDNITLEAKPAKTIFSSLSVKFNNPFAITVSGFNYLSAGVGLDGNNLFIIQSPGIGAFGSGQNSLTVSTNMIFSSEDTSKKAIARFTRDLKEQFGSTLQFFTTSNAMFGTDQQNAFKFLSKAVLGIKSSLLINTANLDYLVNHIPKSALNVSALLGMVQPTNLAVQFNPSDIINAKTSAELKLPFTAKIDMPYFYVGSTINSNRMMNLDVNGLKIASSEKSLLDVGVNVQLLDSPALEDSLNQIAQDIVKNIDHVGGTIGGGFISFGRDNSPANVIDTFSEASLDINLSTVIMILKKSVTEIIPPTFNATELLSSVKPNLKNLIARTLPGRVIENQFTAGFTSSFPITVQGFGYITAGFGINSNQILYMSSNGLHISPGSNSFDLSSRITFPRTDGTPEVLANFVKSAMKNPGETTDLFFGNGITFGFDEDHSFKLFSKAVLPIPSKWLINNQTISIGKSLVPAIDLKPFFSQIFLSKAHAIVTPDSIINSEITGGLSNVSFTAKASFGYVRSITTFDEHPLMELSIKKPITVETKDSQLSMDVMSDLSFKSTDELQNSIAIMANNLMNNQSVSNSAGVTGFSFGSDSSPENIVDTFSKVSISLAISPFVPTIKNLISSIINYTLTMVDSPPKGLFTNTSFQFQNVDLDVLDEDTLISNVKVAVSNLPIDVFIDIPYIFTGVKYNGNDYIFNTVKNLKFKNGVLTLQALIGMPENIDAGKRVMKLIGNILFHRFIPTTDTLTIHSFGFGGSAETSVNMFSKIYLTGEINPVISQVTSHVNATRPIEILNLNAVAGPAGIDADVLLSQSLPFFHVLAHIETEARYQINDSAPLVTACKVPFHAFNLPLIRLTLVPVLTPYGSGGSIDAFTQAAVKILTFEDFASYCTLGYAVMTGTNGKVFTRLSQAGFNAGELILFNPIILNLVPTWPWDSAHPFALQVPIKAVLSFPNMGMLHLDIGRLDAAIVIGNEKVLSASSQGNIVIYNNNEGANQTDPKRYKTMGQFDLSIPLKDLNPVTIYHAIEAMIEGRGVVPDLHIYRGDVELAYFPYVLNGLAAAGVLQDVVPFIGTILGHLKLHIGGKDPLTAPIIGPILRAVEQKLLHILPGSQSHTVQVNSLPEGMLNVTSGTTMIANQNLIVISH